MPASPAASDPKPPLYGRIVLLAILGFAYAALVIWYGHGWFYINSPLVLLDPAQASQSQKFLSYGKSVLWLVLLGAESAVWFVVVGAYAGLNDPPAVTLGARFLRWAPRVSGYAAIVFMFFLPMLYSNLFVQRSFSEGSPLLWHGPKILVVAVPAVVAVVCVVARLREVNHKVGELKSHEMPERIKRYLAYQEDLRFMLGVLGLMLSLNVFATAALRNALLAHEHWAVKAAPKNEPVPSADAPTEPKPIFFDTELVFAFGGAYTFLVIVFYAPVYFALAKAAQAIVREVAPYAFRDELPTGPPPDVLLARMVVRENWEKALGQGQDWLKSVQAGLVLLSPFFAALVSLLLPSGK